MSAAMEITARRGPELQAALSGLFRQMRRDYADALDIIRELGRRQVEETAGYPSLAKYLSDLLRITTRKAAALIVQAEQVAESVTPTGYVAPAKLPLAREALHDGMIDADHLEVIAETVRAIPAWAGPENTKLVEATLIETARTADPRVVRKYGRILLARIDQDGEDPHQEDKLAEPTNELHLHTQSNGWVRFRGLLDPEAGEEFVSLIGALSLPQSPADGVPDPRPIELRRGDGFAQLCHSAAQIDDAKAGGNKPHLHLYLNLNTLLEGVGTATMDGGAFLTASAARRVACDAGLIPVVLNEKSVPLDLGREHRLVKPEQRKALIARDRGCAFPGCHLPARWTDAHHIRHWAYGGTTDLHNLVLLCRRHHRLVHHSEWSIRMINGLPYFKPPKWLDRTQKLRRNVLRQ
ncbi:MAG TPA: DUF222 domain-containing protein [Actinophytocola sp.]|uniref:HNH endonuclease signature motif containing protein n=1 Tax=Actinophytocola sp. TaxID=1872138 RepID=UPI002DB6BFDE|nr:DUF222 domain-containing protein [Actinophytocola sp.]HEU5470593.1 DUF222 domain-containing protein [Actinophytocola sp.]